MNYLDGIKWCDQIDSIFDWNSKDLDFTEIEDEDLKREESILASNYRRELKSGNKDIIDDVFKLLNKAEISKNSFYILRWLYRGCGTLIKTGKEREIVTWRSMKGSYSYRTTDRNVISEYKDIHCRIVEKLFNTFLLLRCSDDGKQVEFARQMIENLRSHSSFDLSIRVGIFSLSRYNGVKHINKYVGSNFLGKNLKQCIWDEQDLIALLSVKTGIDLDTIREYDFLDLERLCKMMLIDLDGSHVDLLRSGYLSHLR